MTKAQEKDLFTEWALYGPQEQKKMIDEYIQHQCWSLQQGKVLKFPKGQAPNGWKVEEGWDGVIVMFHQFGGFWSRAFLE